MPKLIIIRGNSGSGKTSAAKVLQKKFGGNTMLISQDMIRREILYTKDGADTKALPLLTCLLKYGRRNSEITIIEGILKSEWYLPLFRTALEEYNENIFAYYYDIPFEETLLRHETRSKKNSFGEEDMRRWWNEKDYMEIIPEKIFTKEISLSEAVETILKDVSEK